MGLAILPKAEMLQALFALFRESMGLIEIMPDTDGLAKVYMPRWVPPGTVPPYIVLTDLQFFRSWNTFGNNGIPHHGYEYLLTIDSWSKYRGQKEINAIQNIIYGILNDEEPVLPGWNWVSSDLENNHVLEDTSTSTTLQHGVDRYRIKIEEA